MRFSDLSWPMVAGALSLLLSKGCYGQPQQRFEVASIRPANVTADAGTSVELFQGGRIRILNEPVKLLIRQAFRVQDAQIVGGPTWLDTDRYDVEAKTGSPAKVTPDVMGPLMQCLLTERFHLKFHRETREMNVLALVVAKGGPKLKPKGEGEPSGMNTSGGPRESHLIATATSTELLAAYVGNRLNRTVVDQTGLSDSYDFTLNWAPDETAESVVPPLITALREQLGLSLRSQKGPVGVLVIDSLSKPSEN
ncbi:MAG: TIGR03435 family protein [Bryobacteraceae bacterium]